MPNRTMQIIGLGFHETQAVVKITLDGAEIFNGAVPTDTTNPYSAEVNSAQLETAFANPVHTWEIAIPDSSSHSLLIEPVQGDFVFLRAQCNYMPISYVATPTDMFSSGEEGYINCWYETTADGVYRDPNSNVEIDGVSVTPDRSTGTLLGQWNWGVEEGQLFGSTFKIAAGLENPGKLDGQTVVSSIQYTGDGSDNTFVINEDKGDAARVTTVGLIDGVDAGEGWVIDQTSSPKHGSFSAGAPADGATVTINTVERFDVSLVSYANFELVGG